MLLEVPRYARDKLCEAICLYTEEKLIDGFTRKYNIDRLLYYKIIHGRIILLTEITLLFKFLFIKNYCNYLEYAQNISKLYENDMQFPPPPLAAGGIINQLIYDGYFDEIC